jgi:hypothetical protein
MISQKLKSFIFNHWPLISVIVVSFLLPAIWLKEKLVIAYAEAGFTFLINPLKLLDLTRYIWWDIFGLGMDNARALSSSLYHLIASGLQWLGFSAVARQYLVFSAILLLSALAMYFLAIELFRNKKEKYRYIALIVALFYILNPYTMNSIWHRFTTSMLGLPLIPLVFFITVKFFKKPSFRYAFLFAIVTLLFSVNAINPGYFIPLFLPAVSYAIFEIIRTKNFRQCKYLGIGGLLVIGLNFWWIFPLFFNSQIEVARAGILDYFETLKAISQWTPLHYILRLIDGATIHWYGVDYHPGWIEFLIPISAMVAVLFNKRNKNVIFLSFLLIIGLFLSKGLQSPGGNIFALMSSHIPFFEAFRSPFEKFGLIIAFSYSFLVPLGLLEVQRLIKKRFVSIGITAVILILLFGVSVWPMWTGDVFSFWQGAIPEDVKDVPTTKVKIPDYWKEVADYINQDKNDYRVVFLPQSPFDGMTYKWKYGYAGADFGSVNLLFNRPVITQLIGNSYADAYREMVLEKIFLTKPETSLSLFSLMNVRYILVRNDVNETAITTVPLVEIRELLKSVPFLSKLKSFGKLDLYKISDDYFLPHIYSSAIPTIVAGDIEALGPMSYARYLDRKPVLLFPEQVTGDREEMTEKNLKDVNNYEIEHTILEPVIHHRLAVTQQEPKITFKKINSTKYYVQVQGAKSPFWLVFSESFHKQWRIYRAPEHQSAKVPGFAEIVAEYPKLGVREARHLTKFTPQDIKFLFEEPLGAPHHLVNGYANGWYIEPKKLGLGEDFILVLYFWSQSLFYLGLGISGVTLLGCIGYLGYNGLRRKRVTKEKEER